MSETGHIGPDRADILTGSDLGKAAGPPEHAVGIGGRLGFHHAERIGDPEETIALLNPFTQVGLEIHDTAGRCAILFVSGSTDLVVGINVAIEEVIGHEDIEHTLDADRDALAIKADRTAEFRIDHWNTFVGKSAGELAVGTSLIKDVPAVERFGEFETLAVEVVARATPHARFVNHPAG